MEVEDPRCDGARGAQVGDRCRAGSAHSLASAAFGAGATPRLHDPGARWTRASEARGLRCEARGAGVAAPPPASAALIGQWRAEGRGE